MKNYTLNRVKTEKITKNRVYSLNLNTEYPRFQKLVLLVQRSEYKSSKSKKSRKKLSIWIANQDLSSCFVENIDEDNLYKTNEGLNTLQIEHLYLEVTFDDASKIMYVSFPCISYFKNAEFVNFGVTLCRILSDNCTYFACANQYHLVYSSMEKFVSDQVWLHLNDKGLKVDFNRQIHGHPTNGYLMEDDSFDFFGKIFILMKV